jgi:hypothetical protein
MIRQSKQTRRNQFVTNDKQRMDKSGRILLSGDEENKRTAQDIVKCLELIPSKEDREKMIEMIYSFPDKMPGNLTDVSLLANKKVWFGKNRGKISMLVGNNQIMAWAMSEQGSAALTKFFENKPANYDYRALHWKLALQQLNVLPMNLQEWLAKGRGQRASPFSLENLGSHDVISTLKLAKLTAEIFKMFGGQVPKTKEKLLLVKEQNYDGIPFVTIPIPKLYSLEKKLSQFIRDDDIEAAGKIGGLILKVTNYLIPVPLKVLNLSVLQQKETVLAWASLHKWCKECSQEIRDMDKSNFVRTNNTLNTSQIRRLERQRANERLANFSVSYGQDQASE